MLNGPVSGEWDVCTLLPYMMLLQQLVIGVISVQEHRSCSKEGFLSIPDFVFCVSDRQGSLHVVCKSCDGRCILNNCVRMDV